jgi:hypothetical protein
MIHSTTANRNQWLKRHARPAIAFGLILRGSVTIAGFAVMLTNASTPGSVKASPSQWPSDSRLRPVAGRANLVMFAHPRCPCTRASLAELQGILSKCRERVTAQVVFFKPHQESEEWTKSDLWRNAAAMPSVRVLFDEDGREARRFGATTSGHVALFDVDGRLLFRGGITVSRGHLGENAGRRAVIDLLSGMVRPVEETASVRTLSAQDQTLTHSTTIGDGSTFGCPLFCDECVDRAVTR